MEIRPKILFLPPSHYLDNTIIHHQNIYKNVTFFAATSLYSQLSLFIAKVFD
ncbi:hypothetical protein [Kamptonema sp. UHCC 0994]|uniref:hypothetical protein n=1 Tax=Kamptonema sp. UHCC 0994 TaxID=3031329 RepID=UPI0023BA1878|nr:hypothetical protein [Kamptonema sp. UHCC 0994]MDF0552749.1 hypothetical protein [Kamptonema sp. UHCC 0994]